MLNLYVVFTVTITGHRFSHLFYHLRTRPQGAPRRRGVKQMRGSPFCSEAQDHGNPLVRQNDRFFELREYPRLYPKIRVLAVRNTGFANQSSIYSSPMSKPNSVESSKRQNRYSHLMWAGGDLIGPLSANVGSWPLLVKQACASVIFNGWSAFLPRDRRVSGFSCLATFTKSGQEPECGPVLN